MSNKPKQLKSHPYNIARVAVNDMRVKRKKSMKDHNKMVLTVLSSILARP